MSHTLQGKSNPLTFMSRYKSFGELAWSRLQELNDHSVCLIEASTNEVLTIKELKSGANAMAVALIERGITKTDKIAFCGHNSIQHSLLLFATYLIGTTHLQLDTSMEKCVVEQEVRSVGVDIIVTSVDELHKFDDILNTDKSFVKLVIVFDGKHDKYITCEQLLEEGRDQTLDRIPFNRTRLEDILLLIHTSGTFDAQKCAMISHRAFINAYFESHDTMAKHDHTVHTTTAQLSPFSHLMGTYLTIHNILSGGKVIVFKEFDKELLFMSIERYGVDVIASTPVVGQAFTDSALVDKYDTSSLRQFISFGYKAPDYMRQTIGDKYGIAFKEVYAMTEYFGLISGSEPNDENTPNSVGRVSPGVQLKIVDLGSGVSLGAGIEGEIYIRGNALFSGYFHNQSDNNKAFDRDGWYRTGDIGHYDDAHRLFITDSLKEYVDVSDSPGFHRITPAVIERCLSTHKSIAEVIVVGVDNSDGTQWPRAYVHLRDGQAISGLELEKYVSESIHCIKQLKAGIVFVDHIHRTSVGKMDRKYYRNLITNESMD